MNEKIERARTTEHAAPLSFAQQRLWLLDRLIPLGAVYNIQHALRLSGELDEAALQSALNEVARRHEVLRTRFGMQDGEPVQVIAPALEIALTKDDLGDRAPSERESEAQRRAQAAVDVPFDLARGPLIRAQLLRLAPSEHWLLITLHHIVTDGWSSGVLTRELTTLYNAYRRGEPSPLPALPVQYADFAVWQRQWLEGAAIDKLVKYWRTALANLPNLELPTDRPRPAAASYRGERVEIEIPEPLVRSLKAVGRREGATLFMMLLAAYQILLSRYSGQEDVAVGVATAGRSRSELEPMIGFFVNTLVLRSDLSGNPPFRQFLGRVRERALDAYTHQELPFEKLVEELAPKRDLSRNPLFQASFAMNNTPPGHWEVDGLAVTRIDAIPRGTSKFDLALFLVEEAGKLTGYVDYSTDLFDLATIRRMAGHFLRLLEGIVADPQTRLGALPMLGEAERRELLVDWNGTASAYPRESSLPALFEAQAALHPEAVALVDGDVRMTYGELNARANRLARHLRSLGVALDDPVGICLERSSDMIVAMVGTLKAGGAYVPLDPNYPAERLAFMLQDTAIGTLLTQRAHLQQFPTYAGRVVCLDRDAPDIERRDDANPPAVATADALAYIIYTSGSTGEPKGVMVPHRGVARLVCRTDYIALGADDRVAQIANPSFDAATFEIWGALLNGARLVLLQREVTLDPPRFAAQLHRDGITALFVTTALFNAIVRALPTAFAGVKQVLFGGEAVDPRWVRECLAAGAPGRLLHVYGPTETVTFATWHRVEAVGEDAPTLPPTLPIGRPIANLKVAVLDRQQQPVPIGVAGELYIGGEGLARGYWKRPELTHDRFVTIDCGELGGMTMYRTGDLVRYRPDGNLVFLGRLDQQVKLRGHRIEPAEIEIVLRNVAPLAEALVVLREDRPHEPELVAYLVAKAGAQPLPPVMLRTMLKSKLPDYMVPSAFVFLPALPLNPNGKIDRQALPEPEHDGGSVTFESPCTPIETALAEIWAEVLRVPRVGRNDNFFDLGGYSLLAAQLIGKINGALSIELTLRQLFETPTVRELALAALQCMLAGSAESEAQATRESA